MVDARNCSPEYGRTASQARRSGGWDGLGVIDSQNLAGDAYVGLALAARATSTLKLGTGVTNSATRHPAVNAAAIASLQQASNERAVLGLTVAARLADRVMLAVGAAPERITWAVEVVRSENPDALIGAYLNIGCDPEDR